MVGGIVHPTIVVRTLGPPRDDNPGPNPGVNTSE
jgi:hypothetical protein